MSKATNVKAVLCETWADARKIAGGYSYVHAHEGPREVGIMLSCPCGCGQAGGIYFDDVEWNKKNSRVTWKRSGPRERLTIHPSIGMKPYREGQDVESDGYHWHGWLRDGVLQSC